MGNSSIPGYPVLTDEFLDEWHRLCGKYEIIPAEYGHEYGHCIDTRMWAGRNLTVQESGVEVVTPFGSNTQRRRMLIV